jgi:diguanylate cyclase (GGDEF)-like protein/PAS domain S-box-containing protein
MADWQRIDGAVVTRKQIIYGATFVVLFLGYFYLRGSSWRGDIWQHTLMETVATVLSLCVGCLALIRFYSKKNNTFLFIGTGFVATAFLDGYHTFVTSSYFINAFPSTQPSLIAWSWFASRIFLAVLLWLSWLLWQRENRLGAAGQVSEYLVYAIVCLLALATFIVVALAPMPAAYHQVLVFSRPQEIVPALFFLLALIGYLHKGQWKTDPFEHWLVLSLIVGFMGQAMFMSLSDHIYDMMFDAAHLLKDGSYICVLVGLLFNMYLMYSESLTQQELAFKNTVLSTQQEVSQDAILLVNEQGQIISYNHRFVELWNLSQKIVDASDDAPVLQLVVSQVCDPVAFLARVRYLYKHRTEKGNDQIELKDGKIIDRYSAPIVGENGRYYGRGWFFRDITERVRVAAALRESEEKFRTIFEGAVDGILLTDENSKRLLIGNHALCDMLGYSAEEIGQLYISDMHPEQSLQQVLEAFEKQSRGETSLAENIPVKRKDGSLFFADIKASRTKLDNKQCIVSVFRDITERKIIEQKMRELQAQLRDQATLDPLTGLFNRRYLDETSERELIRAKRSGQQIGFVMCDLDLFKAVNDAYGHLIGDEVLRVFADLLKRNTRGSDIACRYGGEEFLLLLPEVTPDLAYQRAEQLRTALEATLITSGTTVIHVTASFGVATFPEHGSTIDELIRAADEALYIAKNAGRNRVVSHSAKMPA